MSGIRKGFSKQAAPTPDERMGQYARFSPKGLTRTTVTLRVLILVPLNRNEYPSCFQID